MDVITIFGLLIGIGGIIIGNALEDGHLSALIQFTAALIVFGGTFGAMLVSNRKEDVKRGFRLLSLGFKKDNETYAKTVAQEIVETAKIVRRESLLSVERRLPTFTNPFMKDVFRFMVDGVEPRRLREVYETKILVQEDKEMAGANIWSDAGGYAPTIGIIGAVLGLIHVMGNLTDTAELGKGIAVAFVATIYGVGSANLVFLPIANKIKRKISKQTELQTMILEGAVAILDGLNPYIIEEKMRAFVDIPNMTIPEPQVIRKEKPKQEPTTVETEG